MTASLKKKSKASGIPLGILRKVFSKGMQAWNAGHRPGVAQHQWGMGRVNSFITGAGGARTVYGQGVLAQIFGANATMNNNDRVRAISGVSEVYPQGATWGTMSSASQNATTAAGNNGISQAVGTGNVSALIGVVGVSFAVPDQGSLNAQYATGMWSQSGFNTATATNRSASTITYARLYAGAINSGGQANLAITNSIGLHTYPFWHANVSAVGSRYAVLNEDTTSTISTAGNIVITASTGTAKSGFMQLGVYTVATLPAVGVLGQIVSISNPTTTGQTIGSLAYWDGTNNQWSWVSSPGTVVA